MIPLLLLLLLLASNWLYLSFATSVSYQVRAPKRSISSNSETSSSNETGHESVLTLQQESSMLKGSELLSASSSKVSLQRRRRGRPMRDSTKMTSMNVKEKFKRLSQIQQRKLYFFAKIKLTRPSLIEQDWKDMQTNNPKEAEEIYEDWMITSNRAALQSYYRKELKKGRFNDPLLLNSMTEKGWKVQDLKPHSKAAKYTDTPQEARLRKTLSNTIKKIRLDINTINRYGYLSNSKGTSQIGLKVAAEGGYLQNHGAVPSPSEINMAEAIEMINEMRRVLRTSPFEPSLAIMRDELQLKIQKDLKHCKVIELPQPLKETPEKSTFTSWSPPSVSGGKKTSNDIARLSDLHAEGGSGPLFLHAMRQKYDTEEKKQRFIHNLFDTKDYLENLPKQSKMRRKRTPRQRAVLSVA